MSRVKFLGICLVLLEIYLGTFIIQWNLVIKINFISRFHCIEVWNLYTRVSQKLTPCLWWNHSRNLKILLVDQKHVLAKSFISWFTVDDQNTVVLDGNCKWGTSFTQWEISKPFIIKLSTWNTLSYKISSSQRKWTIWNIITARISDQQFVAMIDNIELSHWANNVPFYNFHLYPLCRHYKRVIPKSKTFNI